MICWIYRNPVGVYYSRMRRWSYLSDVKKFIIEWNRVNHSAIDAKNRKMKIVQYEDMCGDKALFGKLCKSLKIRGEHLFQKNQKNGLQNLPASTIKAIEEGTSDVFSKLNMLSLS